MTVLKQISSGFSKKTDSFSINESTSTERKNMTQSKFSQQVRSAIEPNRIDTNCGLGTVAWMQDFRPDQVHHYFDRLRVYVKEPLNAQWIAALEKACGAVSSDVGPALFDPRYRQKLEIYQPKPAASKLLARLPDDAIVCYVEIACDVVCPDAYCVERIAQGFLSGFLQPHQRDKESWAYVDYTGCVTGFTTRKSPQRNQRRQGFWFQWYTDKPCRITGDPYCFHFEGKYEGRQAVTRIGIFHPRDLERFDFEKDD